MKKILIASLIVSFLLIETISFSQNIAVTDDDAYTANSSAMLDVKSVTKGLLIPRMTTSQRTAIVSPASSLLVYDTDIAAFYFWTGASWSKIGTSGSDYWLPDGSNIYFNTGNVGVGTSTPGRKMIVKGSSVNINEAIFAVQNTDGDTVFAVYPEGVRVWVNDDGGSKAAGSRGGFAVGGFSPAKAGFTNEYLRVTPDSVRVYIDDDFTGTKAAGNRGGFAVGGFSPTKGSTTDDYLFVQDDSTRVWTNGDGGFEIADLASGSSNYMDLTPENYFIGHQAGDSITTGTGNLFLGYKAGIANDEGNNNIFMGHYSGYSSKDCSHNVFLGSEAGRNNKNTIGSGAFGSYNVLVGRSAGFTNTNGYSNTFLGDQAGYFNTSGYYNTFLGAESGLNNTTGLNNVYVGYRCGYSNAAGGSGSYNVCLGNNSGFSITSGYQNTFIGLNAGYLNNSGNNNIFMGSNAGYDNSTGAYNVFMGNGSGTNNTTGSYNTFIGDQTGFNVTTGDRNIYIGYLAGYSAVSSTGWDNISLGNQSGHSISTGYNNHFIGMEAGYATTTGHNNVFNGKNSGRYNTTGAYNIFIGSGSGYQNTTGGLNVFIGCLAGNENTTGYSNVYVGNESGHDAGTGGWNSCLGEMAGYSNSSGHHNTYIGSYSGYTNTNGVSNVFLGNDAGRNGTTGTENIFIGDGSGYNNAGNYNTMIGTNSGLVNETGSGNVFLGWGSGRWEAGSNKLYIDNSETASPLIYGDFTSNYIYVNGNFKATGILYDSGGDAGASGQVLSSTGAGTNWINSPGNITGTGTATQVAFWTGTSVLSSNSRLYWDNVTYRLGINATPSYKLHVVDDASGDDPAAYVQHNNINNYGIGLQAKGGWKAVLAENASTTGSNYAISATCTGTGASTNYGVHSTASGATNNYAGYFVGNVHVTGTLSKGAGSFMIDHPLDPENKYLYHSFVESPDMKNIYDGVAILDANGKSIVTLPDWFEALNNEFRYQLTPIGGAAPNIHISQEITGNKFEISGGNPGMKISWMVTGIRKDPYANANRIPVEVEKSNEDKGHYLYPHVYNKPINKGIDYKDNKINK